MDDLRLEIKFERPPSQPEGKFVLAVEGSINGLPIASFEVYPLDLDALKASSVCAGDYYIWTCSCGIPACAGFYHPIVVVHGAETISWLGAPRPIDQLGDLQFDKQAYVQEVNRALQQMKYYAHLYRAQGEPFEFALGTAEDLFWRKEDRVDASALGRGPSPKTAKAGKKRPRR
jgi:hypothetical protein